ncbi:hypothetical protein PoB_002369600 [Plakobranchus ocellatus]|uniref:Uncharacterized protein n=1 Tax=Plakobranchus ocellatus TaxID=259542 RepID=A0AAV3ZD56_9GAST|nr:hypothetical protein PoB_002369600 [Plakobranchus ocellatus]
MDGWLWGCGSNSRRPFLAEMRARFITAVPATAATFTSVCLIDLDEDGCVAVSQIALTSVVGQKWRNGEFWNLNPGFDSVPHHYLFIAVKTSRRRNLSPEFLSSNHGSQACFCRALDVLECSVRDAGGACTRLMSAVYRSQPGSLSTGIAVFLKVRSNGYSGEEEREEKGKIRR